MSDPRTKDHWRELADLLGLPPDESQSAPALASSPSPPAQQEVREADPPEAEPVAEDTFEPVGYEEIAITETRILEEQLSAPVEPRQPTAEFAESEAAEGEPAELDRGAGAEAYHDRPRRGRRRGRRGQKDDAPERANPAAAERAPRMEKTREPLEESLGETKEEASATLEEERGERGRGGQGRRRKPAESRQRDVEEEDLVETEDVDRPEPALEEDDDEEIDKLTDWNVPSWTELIGSLYRPER